MKKIFRTILALCMTAVVVLPVSVLSGFTAQAAGGTGAGLAAHAIQAYNEHWQYRAGGQSAGAVDCTGLIISYGYGISFGDTQKYIGTSNMHSMSTLPDTPGVVLWQRGHQGIYIGGGYEIDARDYGYGMVKQSVSSKAWQGWYYLDGIDYGGAATNEPPADTQQANTNAQASASTKAAAPASSAAPVTYKDGSSGSEVKKIQTTLKTLGYYNDIITAFYGQATTSAVKAFQGVAGLKQTGNADSATLQKLYASDAPKCPPPPALTIGSTGESVTKLQNSLKQLSYFRDTVNGAFEQSTADAVSAFQKAAAIAVTGKADNATQNALYADSAPQNPEAGTLKPGMAGDDVKSLQQRLFDLRYTVKEPTGTYDADTETAVKAYQAAASMEQTGIMTKDAVVAIQAQDAALSPEYNNLKLGYKGDDVKTLQDDLIALGYYTGTSTGTFDAATETAVKALQTASSLPVNGVADAAVKDAIAKAKTPSAQGSTSFVTGTLPAAAAAFQETNPPMANAPAQKSAGTGLWLIIFTALFASAGMFTVYFMRNRPAGLHAKGKKDKGVAIFKGPDYGTAARAEANTEAERTVLQDKNLRPSTLRKLVSLGIAEEFWL